MASPSLTRQLTDWSSGFSLDGANAEESRERVKYLLLDHLANAFGGLTAESTAVMEKVVASASGGCPAPGGLRLSEERAALVAGTSAHALESDDTHQPSSSHPGSVIFPAALSISHTEDCSFDDFASSVVAGYEVMARIGVSASARGQYLRGFHPTGTCGVFGAAAASSRLLGLDSEQTNHALGICGSLSTGSMEFLTDGAWTKRIHPGWAAQSGILAARLANGGFLGPQDPLGGPSGFLQGYSDHADPALLTDGLGREPFAVERTSIKAHACCRYMQAPIDAVLNIVRREEVEPDSIDAITIGVLEAGWDIIAAPAEQKRRPQSLVDAQFSMPFGAAVAALHGSASVADFEPSKLTDGRMLAMMDKVECVRSAKLDAQFPARWPAEVQVRLRDGAEFSESVDFPKGDPENPLSWPEMRAKFRALTRGIVAPVDADAVIEHVDALKPGQSMRSFVEAVGAVRPVHRS